MSPWSTSRATPSLGSSPCPRRPRSIVPSITGSDGASRRCSPTSSPGASGWQTASSATQSGWGACSSSWRWPCIGPCPRACGTPRIGLCPPKKSLNAKAEQGGPRPNFPLQARPAPHPTSPSAPDPAPAPLERLAELMDGKVPRVPALDIVAEPLVTLGASREEARARASALLARLNIPERLWPLPPATFSGGEQQRLNIARGFVHPYPLLLLDGPTASLDAANRAAVAGLVREARARGAALVGIFHDEDVRDAVATRRLELAPVRAAP